MFCLVSVHNVNYVFKTGTVILEKIGLLKTTSFLEWLECQKLLCFLVIQKKSIFKVSKKIILDDLQMHFNKLFKNIESVNGSLIVPL